MTNARSVLLMVPSLESEIQERVAYTNAVVVVDNLLQRSSCLVMRSIV